MQNIKKYFMTLALLLTAVTGAWAQDPKVYDSGEVELSSLQVGDILLPGVTLTSNNPAGANLISKRYTKEGVISQYANSISSIPFSIGENGLIIVKLAGDGPYNCMPITEDGKAGNAWEVTNVFAEPDYKTILIGGTTYADPNAIDVTPGEAANTWTFAMPGSDVVLTPQYAPAAKWDVENAGSAEEKVLLPAALEGIIAGQDAAIVTAGQSAQGTVMYAVTTTAEAAPALTAFSPTVPTAKDVADDGATLYVWYYIQGHDTPDGQQATEENTFNDSEISTTPLTVQVLTNKFDIQFTAANANTIQAGKATVTVGGTAATVTDGKLQGVKMGSEVKMTAKPGYKFRKVEVKKAAPALKILTVNGKQLNYVEGDTWQQAIERPENAGSGWNVQGNYIFNGGYTLFTFDGGAIYVYVRPGDTIDATKDYSLEAD